MDAVVVLPQTADLNVNATDMLQIEDPAAVADVSAAFFTRHPI
jgi:hypothetical protein